MEALMCLMLPSGSLYSPQRPSGERVLFWFGSAGKYPRASEARERDASYAVSLNQDRPRCPTSRGRAENRRNAGVGRIWMIADELLLQQQHIKNWDCASSFYFRPPVSKGHDNRQEERNVCGGRKKQLSPVGLRAWSNDLFLCQKNLQ